MKPTAKSVQAYVYSSKFPIQNSQRQGATAMLLLAYAARKGIEYRWTHEVLLYADDLDLLGGKMYIIDKNRSFVIASK
jgi:hypothetical protein